MTLTLADVSEFQGAVDWHAYVHGTDGAAVIRVHNGNRPDHNYAANRTGFWAAKGRALGLYQYLVAGRDPGEQAHEFVNTLGGTLRPGEFPVLDHEEGSGDQAARAAAWRAVVTTALDVAPWLYTGLAYYKEHGLAGAGFQPSRLWIADWATVRPSTPHSAMWQFTDNYGPLPGITHRHDASHFYGSITDLANTAKGGSNQLPPGSVKIPYPGTGEFGPGANNQYVTMLGQWLVAKGYGRFYTVGPSPSWGQADHDATRAFQLAQGWTGPDADGVPGPQTWSRLQD